jgi:hypothetical protein
MHMRFAALLLLAGVAGHVAAMDATDVATYRIMSVNNEPTKKLLRLAGGPGSWRVEEKRPDGTWHDVTCEGGCRLEESKESDFKRFFPFDDLSAVTMTCLHNSAFALCRYGRKSIAEERGYVFVALTEQYPVHLPLEREK